MTDGQQIALAIAPTALPAITVLVGTVLNNRQIGSLRNEIHAEFDLTRRLFEERLRRVEDMIDARFNRLEEK